MFINFSRHSPSGDVDTKTHSEGTSISLQNHLLSHINPFHLLHILYLMYILFIFSLKIMAPRIWKVVVNSSSVATDVEMDTKDGKETLSAAI